MTPVPSAKQIRFTLCVGKLIAWASARNYGLTFGEAYRLPWVAGLMSSQGTGILAKISEWAQTQTSLPGWVTGLLSAGGKGIANSQHGRRLAVDLMLFINGTYQTDSQAYAELGAFWKTLDPDARWGGDFVNDEGKPRPDGNHFSFEHDGIK